MIPKPIRLVDKKLLREIKKWPCVACKIHNQSDPAHIRSKGCRGPDIEWNVIPLCRNCHSLQHQHGWKRFLDERPILWYYLQTIGWYWIPDRLADKLWNDKLSK